MIPQHFMLMAMAVASANMVFSVYFLAYLRMHPYIIVALALPIFVSVWVFWIGVFDWRSDDPDRVSGLPVPLRYLLAACVLLGLGGWRMMIQESPRRAAVALLATPMAIGFPIIGFVGVVYSIRFAACARTGAGDQPDPVPGHRDSDGRSDDP